MVSATATLQDLVDAVDEDIDIENNDNVLTRLPSENVENSLKNYRSLMKTNKIIKSNLIDLRIKNKIIFTYEKK